jgi:hypothetical protein
MLKSLVTVALVLSTSHALADSFACELRANRTYSIGYEPEYRSRIASAKLGDFACHAAMVNGQTRVSLYNTKVGEQGVATATGEARRETRAELDGALCTCGLM